MSRLSVPIAILAASLNAASAAQPDAPVHTIRIDARAVDARGAFVRTLTARDFEVREDGKPVALDELQLVDAEAPKVAIYVDEYHITPGSNAERTRAALTGLLDRHLGADASVVVMKPLDSIVAIRPQDRDQARRIVGGIEGRRGDYAPRGDYERTYMAESPDRIEASRQQVAISAIDALAVYLGTLGPGRKLLFVVAETLGEPSRRRGQEYLATAASVTRAANRSNVSIYPIDPTYPIDPVTTADAPGDVLGALAEQTDGRRIRGSGDLAVALEPVVAEARTYYLLTYRNSHVEDGAFHPVQVSVKRPGVHVRARAGYWAPAANDRLGAELLAAANRPAPPVRYELPQRTSRLIRPWFGLSLGDGGRMRVTFVWEPAAAVPGEVSGAPAARVELTATGEDDGVLFEGAVLPVRPGVLNGAAAEPSRAVFDVAPGRMRLRMTIQDGDRRSVDFDVRDFLVRDLRGKLNMGTPEILRARNAREFRLIETSPQAVPVSSREFSRAERLLIRFPIYAPAGQPVTVRATLLNRAGQPMRTIDVQPSPMTTGEQQIDLALAGLPTGDYFVDIVVTGGNEQMTERVGFRVRS